MKTNTTASINP